VKNADFRPVKLSGKYTTTDGKNHHFAAANLEARARATAAAVVIGPDGQPKPDRHRPGLAGLQFASTRPEVAEVLDIMGRAEPLGWVDLYKVHEIIRDAIKPKKIYKLGWATKAEDSAFTESANQPDASGGGARHARMPGLPPKRKMSLVEGRSYVSNLVTTWLDSQANP